MFKLYIALTSEWNKREEPLSKEQIKEFVRIFLAGAIPGVNDRAMHRQINIK